jgi:hypothetical protein
MDLTHLSPSPALVGTVLGAGGTSIIQPLVTRVFRRRNEDADTSLKQVQAIAEVCDSLTADWERRGKQIDDLEARVNRFETTAASCRCTECPFLVGGLRR